MPEAKRYSGKCLCGAVRFEADIAKREVGACHCDICRKWTAGPFMVIDGPQNVVLAGVDALGVYHSSEWGERGFCKSCGTSLFWRSRDGEHYSVSVEIFDDLGDVTFTEQIFIDSKPKHYDFANETRRMTGAEFLAQFAAEGK